MLRSIAETPERTHVHYPIYITNQVACGLVDFNTLTAAEVSLVQEDLTCAACVEIMGWMFAHRQPGVCLPDEVLQHAKSLGMGEPVDVLTLRGLRA